ncbi:hypothetical protein VTK26DRAFT_2177 [Humicola hyalothermophila]
MPAPIKPLCVFSNIEEFARRHREGTEAEFAADLKFIEETNKKALKFQAWVVIKTRQTTKRTEYLVLVQPGQNGERNLPQLNEPARLRVILGEKEFTRFWDARRIENPLASLTVAGPCLDKVAAFQVTVYLADAHSDVRPIIDASSAPFTHNWRSSSMSENKTSIALVSDSSSTGPSTASSPSGAGDDCMSSFSSTEPSEGVGEISLTSDNAVEVQFLLMASEATKNAELMALEQLYGRHVNATERQLMAFRFFVLLRNPEFTVDLHEEIPHLKGAMTESSWPGSPLANKFALLNPQQKAAYMQGFHKLNCGICILPGGPGAGKTHFNLFTIAIAQSRPLPRPFNNKGRLEKRCAKVLFIVDMNSPVDDVANRMVRLYNELGMKKSIIRMKGWGCEVKSSGRLNDAEDAAAGEEMTVDFSNQFLRTVNLMSLGHGPAASGTCKAPSLDEAAWKRYDELKSTKYEAITQYLNEELWEESEVLPLRFRRLVYHLYRDTLAEADFIATTPVAASNHFRGMFKPDLVYFDEAPHARELCNLIAIANFDPIAWIFCGDHRQTVPYVGSATPSCPNIYRDQMQVSMMERAAAAGAIQYELLMNHRAFGGLEQLASCLWYQGKMVSGNQERTPPALMHSRKYLESFTSGRRCAVPRLLVHLEDCGPEALDGTSAWNPSHTKWVMARVEELVNDENFRHADRDEPGTILIISPYKKAYNEYKNAVKNLPHWAQRRVETRTVDVAQGHEADYVFLDLVREKSTKFLDDPNRLCVAVTRVRFGEVIMMHPKMVESTAFVRHSQHLRRIHAFCKAAGQVSFVNADAKAGTTAVTTNDVVRVDKPPVASTINRDTMGKHAHSETSTEKLNGMDKPRTPCNMATKKPETNLKDDKYPCIATTPEQHAAVAPAVSKVDNRWLSLDPQVVPHDYRGMDAPFDIHAITPARAAWDEYCSKQAARSNQAKANKQSHSSLAVADGPRTTVVKNPQPDVEKDKSLSAEKTPEKTPKQADAVAAPEVDNAGELNKVDRMDKPLSSEPKGRRYDIKTGFDFDAVAPLLARLGQRWAKEEEETYPPGAETVMQTHTSPNMTSGPRATPVVKPIQAAQGGGTSRNSCKANAEVPKREASPSVLGLLGEVLAARA